MQIIEKVVLNYLKSNELLVLPYALALSGGTDSMALYEILKKIRKPALVIHVNHGMRIESDTEEFTIIEITAKDQIAIEVVKLEGFDFNQGNIEDRLRQKRQEIFTRVLKKYGITNLLTGHQKNDAEENIFKRILEGSSLFKISNFLKVKNFEAYTVHKPMLALSKEEILCYLKINQIRYFDDLTNYDTRFLRSKLRLDLFPALAQMFGKKITDKFYDLGTDLLEVNDYLNSKVSPYLKNFEEGKYGVFFPRMNLHPIEFKWILSQFLESQKISTTRDQIKLIVEAYFKNESNKRFIFKNHELYIEKYGVFLLKTSNIQVCVIDLGEANKIKNSISGFWKGEAWTVKYEQIPYFIRKKIKKTDASFKALTIQFE